MGTSRHLVGGDITYECLSSNGTELTIEVTLNIYRDILESGNTVFTDFDSLLWLGIYRGSPNNWDFIRDPAAPRGTINIDEEPITILRNENLIDLVDLPFNPCFINPDNLQFERAIYRDTITLPIISEDYFLAYQRCCRNGGVVNIDNSSETGIVLSFSMTPVAQNICNTSPSFTTEPELIICSNEFVEIDFSAFDNPSLPQIADQLRYSFCNPIAAGGLNGLPMVADCPRTDPLCDTNCDGLNPWPFQCSPDLFDEINYNTNLTNPIPGLSIDSNTGIISGTPTSTGLFVLAVCVEEIKDGNILSSIRRDFQFTITPCQDLVSLPGPEGADIVDVISVCNGVTTNDLNTCGEFEVQLENYTDADQDNVTWEWLVFDDNNNVVYNTTSEWEPEVTLSSIGRFEYQLTLNPGLTCESVCNSFIRIDPIFEIEFEEVGDPCSSSGLMFDSNESILPPDLEFEYTWDFGDGNTLTGSSNDQNIRIASHNYSTPGTYIVMLTAEFQNCTEVFSLQVIVAQTIPTPNFNISTNSACALTDIVFENDLPDNRGYQFLWDFGGDGTSTEREPTKSFSTAGTFPIKLRITDPATTCEINVDVTDVMIADLVPLTFDIIEPADCSGDPISIIPPRSIPSYTYIWDFGDGNTSSQRDPDPFSYSDDGDYDIQLFATNGICEFDSMVTVSFVINPDPVNITVPSNRECVGNPITFNNTIPSDYDVTWSFGDGNMSTALEPIHTYDRANTFTVSVQAVAPNGCPADSPEVMIQTEEKPDVTFSVDEQAICSGDPIQITGPSASPNTTYDWDFGNGTNSTDRDPDPISYAMEDDYIITLTASNPSCSDNSTQTVSYFLPPDAFTVRPSEFLKCSPAEITFENTLPTSSAFSAEWDFDDGNSSTETSPIHTFGNGGIYNVTFNLIAPNGEVCDQRTIPIDIIDGPDADFSFSPNPVLNPNDVVRFTNLTTPITSSFEWEFGDGNDSSQDSPSHIFGLPGDYEVRLIAKSVMNACVDTAFAIVPVSSTGAPEYPNAFRPSTGENLEFKGVSIFSGFTTYRLTIWDRWGQQIFESSDFEEGWNGRKDNSGGILPQGVYVYKADYTVDVAGELEEFQKSGTVLLIN